MDTQLTIGVIVLIVAAILLVLVSAAEAGVAAVSRRRVRRDDSPTVNSLLDRYITQRQHILRSLSIGNTIATVAITLAIGLLVADGRDLEPGPAAVVGVIALAGVGLLRQNARIFALVNPEATGLQLARLIATLQLLLTPIAWLLGLPARRALGLFGRTPESAEANPAGELLALLEAPPGPDVDEALTEERRMMRGVLQLSGQTVREIMSPRIDIVAVSTDASIGDVMKLISSSGFSRIPLYEESIDRVVGVLYAKDLLAYLQSGFAGPSLRQVARPPYVVPETKRADELLADLRRDQTHVAIVVDEYGGTAGLVTVEDILEEIVGEIADEYDVEEVEVERVSEHEAIVDARLAIDDLNELFEVHVENGDFDTVGGLILSLLGRLAAPGDTVQTEDGALELAVLSVHGRRIRKVRCTLQRHADEAAAV